MPLTQQEKNFVDYLDYEGYAYTSDPSTPVPACNWMTAHRLSQREVWNLLMLRRWERVDPGRVEKPAEPYAPAWKTAEEARQRNQEVAEEFRDAENRRLSFRESDKDERD